MRKSKKKPCPICGDKKITLYRVLVPWWHIRSWFCECEYCHFCAKSAHTARGAIRRWNKSTNIVRVTEAKR